MFSSKLKHLPPTIIKYNVPKNNLNLSLKTEPVTTGADAMGYLWYLGQIYYTVCTVNKNQANTVASAPAVSIYSIEEG